MICDFQKIGMWDQRWNGEKDIWKEYKIHEDWIDDEVLISFILTSVSLNDSQTAIPLTTMSSDDFKTFITCGL